MTLATKQKDAGCRGKKKSSKVLPLVPLLSGYCADMDIMSPLVPHSFVIVPGFFVIMFFVVQIVLTSLSAL